MQSKNDSSAVAVQALWEKYEDIAMHFNDLLMRLRQRSLAGIAAVSTLISIFSNKNLADVTLSWLVAAGLFTAMAVGWIAIFCLDFFYYNKLLNGAVAAIRELEDATKEGRSPTHINLSTMVEEEFAKGKKARAAKGVLAFYGIVFALVVAAAAFSLRMYSLEAEAAPALPAASSPPGLS